MTEPRYAPAREDGQKPWVVELRSWGRSTFWITWAATRNEAEYQVKGRQMYVTTKARRATPADMAKYVGTFDAEEPKG